MTPLPTPPDVPAEQRGETRGHLRYEDISQDGRLMVNALAPFLGGAVWSSLGRQELMHAVTTSGIVPILTKLMLRGGGGPIAVRPQVEARGRYELAHGVDEHGEVERLFLNMWCRVEGPRGRTYGPPPEGAGEAIFVGELFAEHVFTRLFAPPELRKVRRFELPGVPAVPAARHVFAPPAGLLELPAGASWVDEGTVDEGAVVFGIMHTDSNQHVNSMVYPRLFEEAALRRLDAAGLGAAWLCRAMDVAYRKPCFAGDRVRISLRLAREAGGRIGAIGAFVPVGGEKVAPGRPSTTVAAWFER